jgi:uncharacterized protein YaeQ
MALRSTIYKADLDVADNDRGYYASHALTLARHPSETDERMMVRLLAYALHADEQLAFTRGLSETDEPALWRKDLTDAIDLWVEVGHPDDRRILKAAGKARDVVVYCYGGHASEVWWAGVRGKVERAKSLRVVSLPASATRELAALAARNMALQAMVTDGEVLVTSGDASVTVVPQVWRQA